MAAKRGVDLVAGGSALIVVAPGLALIAAAIRISMGRPVLYRQERPGLAGETFQIVKFRTMSQARDADGRLLQDEERITRLGQWLRKVSLDELPELVNVVRGEMSLVGPRPLVKAYLPRYSAVQARRHEVKPGLTGLAQVSGRNALSWGERFALDVYYVDHQSFALDLRILALTAVKLLTGKGDAADGALLSSTFHGDDAELAGREAPRWDPEHDVADEVADDGSDEPIQAVAGGRGKHSHALGHPSR
jgi:lipopolysaccharide/colanic/teichoic acid biosynthesis glycosyltransferase